MRRARLAAGLAAFFAVSRTQESAIRLDISRLTDPNLLAPLGLKGLAELVGARVPGLAKQAKACKDLVAMSKLLQSGVDGLGDALHDVDAIHRLRKHEHAEELLETCGIEIEPKESIESALIRASIETREAFETAHDHATVTESKQVSSFVHYAPKSHLILPKGWPTSKDTAALQKAAKSHFESAQLGPHCEVRQFREEGEIGFIVSHGSARQSEQLINTDEVPEVMLFRLPRRDVLLLNTTTGVLRISARKESERLFYASQFSELLFDEPEVFETTEAFSLDRICEPDYANVLTQAADSDIEAVVLRELRLSSDDELATRMVLTSRDVLGTAKERGIDLSEYTPEMAKFGLTPSKRGKGRKGRRTYHLTVWKGDKLKYDSPWSPAHAQEFVERLGLNRDGSSDE